MTYLSPYLNSKSKIERYFRHLNLIIFEKLQNIFSSFKNVGFWDILKPKFELILVSNNLSNSITQTCTFNISFNVNYIFPKNEFVEKSAGKVYTLQCYISEK